MVVNGVEGDGELDRLLPVLEALEGGEPELWDGPSGTALGVPVTRTMPVPALARALGVDPNRVEIRTGTRADWASAAAPPGPTVRWFGPLRLEVLPEVGGASPAPPPVAPCAGRGHLRIQAEGAFGTGLHPSTALILEVIGERRPSAILDVGTGSGILALAALALGAERAVGTDVDPRSLSVAARNAALNRLDGRLHLTSSAPDALGEVFPLLVANILPAELEAEAERLARALAPAGSAWISGLRETHVAWMQATFRRRGLRPLGVRRRGPWVALELLAPG